MLSWILKNKYSIMAGIVITYFAANHEYIRRRSFQVGGEYLFLFLPWITSSLKEIWRDSKEMFKETFEEVKSWYAQKNC